MTGFLLLSNDVIIVSKTRGIDKKNIGGQKRIEVLQVSTYKEWYTGSVYLHDNPIKL